ncbi:hypothetical protein M501DRAFT_926880 [Patellaria atrata CBS 101060]|uniref:Ras guanyl-nucleotide exchange factor RasGEF n=1 Tax=Patellaria atrata CBS 101060 TaxID=1346257 RepID=A0A9P4SHU5_9PEZI|nr:hypothetical protein M501DRAFT_926880 [Patellaria atrata CBS 101060]
MSSHSPALRSIYRRLLRELPSRSQGETILSSPSPLQRRIRNTISTPIDTTSAVPRIEEAEQFIQYAQAQRMYATLIERYNPGMNMNEEERVRLTARRVGMNLPITDLFEKK